MKLIHRQPWSVLLLGLGLAFGAHAQEVGPLTEGANSDDEDAATVPRGNTDMLEDSVDPDDPVPTPAPSPKDGTGGSGDDGREPTLPPEPAPATEYDSSLRDDRPSSDARGPGEDPAMRLLDEPSEGPEVEKGQVNDDPLR